MHDEDPYVDFDTWSNLFTEHCRSKGYAGPIDIESFRDLWADDNKSAEAYADDWLKEIMPPAPTLTTCAKVCAECPFKASSLPGWLGPHTVDEILKTMQSEQTFSCHMQRTDESTDEDVTTGKLNICRGFLVSASLSFKLFGTDPTVGKELLRLQREVREEHDQAQVEIMSGRQFRFHHSDENDLF